MQKKALKPCPYCGRAVSCKFAPLRDYWMVTCHQGCASATADTEAAAIERWSRTEGPLHPTPTNAYW
jgi:hypothetical protein